MLQQMPPPFAWSRVEHDARGCRLSRGVSQGAQTTPKHRTCRHFMHSRATCCDSEKQTLRSYGSEGFWFNSKWVRQSRPRTNGSPFLKSHEGSPIEQDSAMPSLVPHSSPLWTKAAQNNCRGAAPRGWQETCGEGLRSAFFGNAGQTIYPAMFVIRNEVPEL